MSFSPGDKVLVRKPAVAMCAHQCNWVPGMDSYDGEVHDIATTQPRNPWYTLADKKGGIAFVFCECWLTPAGSGVLVFSSSPAGRSYEWKVRTSAAPKPDAPTPITRDSLKELAYDLARVMHSPPRVTERLHAFFEAHGL